MSPSHLKAFIAESNRIEGIDREPTQMEIVATKYFLAEKILTIPAVVALVKVYQPDAVLRDRKGLDVRVGSYFPPAGGPGLYSRLYDLLRVISEGSSAGAPFRAHRLYEDLHPFTDGNGRSGRAIWLWHHDGNAPLGFLHAWYYESLQAAR